jgi:hypothetical protein
MLTLTGSSAASAPTTVGLGTAGTFAVLAHTGVTDVPTSAITGDVGLSPTTGAAITGLTCPEVSGTIYTVDAAGPLCRTVDTTVLTNASNDRDTAYGDAAARTPDSNLGTADGALNTTLTPGVYVIGHAPTANLTGTLTLNGGAASVWIFQASSDLVFASASSVVFTGGAQACNVFWQVSSSATLGTTSSIAGTILAHTSIVIQHGASLAGRALAETGNVTLDANSIQRPACASSGGSSAPVPVPGPPDRALYCSPSGQSYNLVKGEDKLPPYDALNLVPAYVNPVTGSVSCNFPSTVSTPATTTTTAASPPPPATTTTSTPPVTTTTAPYKPAPVKKTKAAVKAAKRVRVAHVAPKPARHQGGFTG